MFYYLLHIPLIHLIAIAVCYARYGRAHWMFESPTVGRVSNHTAAGLGIFSSDCLPGVGQSW
jgi:hypothetical protein